MNIDQFRLFFDKIMDFAALLARFYPGDADDKVVAALRQCGDEIFGLLQKKGVVN